MIEHGARFTVVKNTLTKRAAEAAGADTLLAMLEGPTAIAFIEADGDMVGVAKALSDAARDDEDPVDPRWHPRRQPDRRGRRREPRDAPAPRVLRGQVLGAITAPLTTVVGLISAPVRDLIGLIDARIEQLQAEGQTEGLTPEGLPHRNRGSGRDRRRAGSGGRTSRRRTRNR